MYVNSKCFGGAGALSINNGNGKSFPLVFVGASVTVGALPGETVWSLTMNPTKGKNGVVVVASDSSDSSSWIGAISLGWEGDKLVVEDTHKSKQGFVNPERIGQAYSNDYDHWVEVQIGDDRFTSSKKRTSVAHFVPDPNLLCRYWAGHATPEQVSAAVRAEKKLVGDKKSLIEEVRKHYARAENLQMENQDLRNQLIEMERKNNVPNMTKKSPWGD